MKHPMQPVQLDAHKTVRFVDNPIVRKLLDLARAAGVADLNTMATWDVSDDDRAQFAQLIGYSVSGFHELPYVSAEHADAASALAEEIVGHPVGCRAAGCPIHGGK